MVRITIIVITMILTKLMTNPSGLGRQQRDENRLYSRIAPAKCQCIDAELTDLFRQFRVICSEKKTLGGSAPSLSESPASTRRRAHLEGHAHLALITARRYKVCPTESRLKIIERYLIRQVKHRKSERHFCMLRAQQVVRSRTEVKQVTRCYARRIAVVIFSSVSRNTYP